MTFDDLDRGTRVPHIINWSLNISFFFQGVRAPLPLRDEELQRESGDVHAVQIYFSIVLWDCMTSRTESKSV